MENGYPRLLSSPAIAKMLQLGPEPAAVARNLLAAVRADVMLKWIAQHHEMELSDGEKTYKFVGVPEW